MNLAIGPVENAQRGNPRLRENQRPNQNRDQFLRFADNVFKLLTIMSLATKYMLFNEFSENRISPEQYITKRTESVTDLLNNGLWGVVFDF
ncbi:hypothetical protein DID74_02415 [Candidatus Marinamargulisbacteria bacterium SCGC AG-333-B06]|nr:hypothetical protein DID74_02415 [Candidatus Marinamargulisbacteria bacterium SCGC AG-333-B06]